MENIFPDYLYRADVNPNHVYWSAQKAHAFVAGDLEGTGQYSLIHDQDSARHGSTHPELLFGWVESLLNGLEPTKENLIQLLSPYCGLPFILGRVGMENDFHTLTFWPPHRILSVRLDLTQLPGYRDGETDFSFGSLPIQIPRDGEFAQAVRQHVIPLLEQKQLVNQYTVWYDFHSRFQGFVHEERNQEAGVDLGDEAPTEPYVERYRYYDRDLTRAEILMILHGGTAEEKDAARRWLCETRLEAFERDRTRLQCEEPSRYRPPRGVDMRRLEFRSQRSLNRAWEAELERRQRLSRRLAGVEEEVDLDDLLRRSEALLEPPGGRDPVMEAFRERQERRPINPDTLWNSATNPVTILYDVDEDKIYAQGGVTHFTFVRKLIRQSPGLSRHTFLHARFGQLEMEIHNRNLGRFIPQGVPILALWEMPSVGDHILLRARKFLSPPDDEDKHAFLAQHEENFLRAAQQALDLPRGTVVVDLFGYRYLEAPQEPRTVVPQKTYEVAGREMTLNQIVSQLHQGGPLKAQVVEWLCRQRGAPWDQYRARLNCQAPMGVPTRDRLREMLAPGAPEKEHMSQRELNEALDRLTRRQRLSRRLMGSSAGYFSPEALKQAEEQSRAYKSRDKLVYMSPDEFLGLAAKLDRPSGEKQKTVQGVLDRGEGFDDIPRLMFVHDGKGEARVVGHEGRHRALALKGLGVQRMPVLLSSQGRNPIRWSEQNKQGSPDRLQGEWPRRLLGESGGSIPFPVQDPLRDEIDRWHEGLKQALKQ